MKVCILMGSPRPEGNTAELLKPFIAELKNHGCEVEYITLADKKINSCQGCHACQHISGKYGCVQNDDVGEIMDSVIKSDCVVYATPIYMWYCTTPLKAFLDRQYGLNKFYGEAGKSSLWNGQKIAIVATHGDDASIATSAFENSLKHWCGYSDLKYMGIYSVKDEDGLSSFQTEAAVTGAKNFARQLLE
jgi:multimeric flavodoxin WrbA